MELPGRYYKIISRIVRAVYPLKDVEPLSKLDTPCVLLCRHRNMRGPFATILHYADNASPWIFYPFCEKDAYYKQMSGYTFSTRLGWPLPLAKAVAWPLSRVAVPLINSLGGIPVYRQDARIRETFRISVDHLCSGRSVMIYPDIDYIANTTSIGDIYDGFFMLERLYFKKTHRHLPFVPVHLDTKKRRMWFGDPVVFGDGTFSDECAKAKEAIIRQWQNQT